MNDSERGGMPERLSMLIDHLALAEDHIALGKSIIARQHALLHELERDGHDIEMAAGLLAQYEDLQAMNIAHRNRILAELAEVKT